MKSSIKTHEVHNYTRDGLFDLLEAAYGPRFTKLMGSFHGIRTPEPSPRRREEPTRSANESLAA